MTGKELKIGIIGAGKAGTALALGLNRAGYSVTAVASRSPASAQSLAKKLPAAVAFVDPQSVADGVDLIFITTPDAAISQIASSIRVRSGQMVCHVSAAEPIEVLNHLRAQGALTGIFHPLQAISSINKAEILPGITFAIEAEEPLLGIMRGMTTSLGGRIVELSGSDRVLYHASAVMASNYLVTLVSLAADLWKGFATRDQTLAALLPLIRGIVDNIEAIGLPDCLTGPISRGDTGTVKRHLAALSGRAPRILDVYRYLGTETISLALAKGGINQDKATQMKELLEIRP